MAWIVRREAAPAAIWAPCPDCWGQGRIYRRGEDRRLLPVACYRCLGVGQALRLPPPSTEPEGSRG